MHQGKSIAAALLVLFGLTLGVTILEGTLWLYDWMHPAPVGLPPKGLFWSQNQEYGWIHPPNYTGAWYDNHGEFLVQVTTNSRGLRDVEHTLEKPPGVFRILILGDSYMEGLQVPQDALFARLLEKGLNKDGRRIEVINSGVASWGTDNELEYFRQEGIKYDPDLVLLAFTTANDVRNNYPPLNRLDPSPNLHKPTFALRDDGTLELTPSPPPFPPKPPPPPQPWWMQMRLAQLLSERFPVLFSSPPPVESKNSGGGAALPPGPLPGSFAPSKTAPPATAVDKPNVSVDMLVYSPTYTPEVATAWKLTKALLRALRDDVQASGARFAVVVVNGPWVHNDQRWRYMMDRDPAARDSWDKRRPNKELGLFLITEKIPSVDLFDPFETNKKLAPLFYREDPHWTADGNKVAATVVERFLTSQDLVPSSN